MRVIAGSAKSLRLKTIEGDGTRPTTDRIKETLFNMINNDVFRCNFLDLFSGSGAIGIEALSRGANKAVFVECNKKAAACIKENLKFTHLAEKAKVMETTASSAVNILNGQEVFDIVFMDPPYNNEHEKMVLKELCNSNIINNESIIIVESSKETVFDYVKDLGFDVIKEKVYKTNKHVFLKLIEKS